MTIPWHARSSDSLLFFTAVLGLLTACQSGAPTGGAASAAARAFRHRPQPPQPVVLPEPVGPPPMPPSPNVALLVPLSGPHARVGEALAQCGPDGAVRHRRRRDGADRARHRTGTPEGAKAALESAFEAGASLILGPLFGTSAQAIAEDALARQVSLISFSNDVTVARARCLRDGRAAAHAGQPHRVASLTTQGHQRFAVMAPQSGLWQRRGVGAFQEALIAVSGGELAQRRVLRPERARMSRPRRAAWPITTPGAARTSCLAAHSRAGGPRRTRPPSLPCSAWKASIP